MHICFFSKFCNILWQVKYTVTVSKHHIWGCGGARVRCLFLILVIEWYLYCLFFFLKNHANKHSNRDLNSLSSTDTMNRSGFILSPAPRVHLLVLRRAAASSSGRTTFQSVQPTALISLHHHFACQWVDIHRPRHLRHFNILCLVPLIKCENQGVFIHHPVTWSRES